MYGTKNTSKGVNKGAAVGEGMKSGVQHNVKATDETTKGQKELDSKSTENVKKHEEIESKINKEDDLKKEEKLREEQKGSETEEHKAIVKDPKTGEEKEVVTATTKDKNTNTNDNVVEKQPENPAVPEKLVSEDGKEATIDVNNVKDVSAEETKKSTPAVEEKVDNKVEDKKSTGIQSMFPEEDDNEDSKEFSKQDELKAVEEDKKEVLAEVTEESTPEVKVVEEQPKAKVVETVKEVKTNKVAEEKVEEKVEKTTFVDTCISVQRTENATFKVTSGKILSVQADDEQISVSNTESTITVVNNFKEFDGTISLRAITPDGTVDLVVIFK